MITNQTLWQEWQDKNKDPYGNCCVAVARRVMEILDEDPTPLHAGHTARDVVHKANGEILDPKNGITGAMAGFVASMVMNCHSRGEEFKTSWME